MNISGFALPPVPPVRAKDPRPTTRRGSRGGQESKRFFSSGDLLFNLLLSLGIASGKRVGRRGPTEREDTSIRVKGSLRPGKRFCKQLTLTTVHSLPLCQCLDAIASQVASRRRETHPGCCAGGYGRESREPRSSSWQSERCGGNLYRDETRAGQRRDASRRVPCPCRSRSAKSQGACSDAWRSG